MITRENIIERLNEKGFNSTMQDNLKNGVVFEGIAIRTSEEIAPVIYTNRILECANHEGKSIDEVVNEVIRVYENHKKSDIDVKKIFERDFMLNNIYIGVQRESEQDLEKGICEFEGIESYLYIGGEGKNGENYTIKLSSNHLKMAGISVEEAWKCAEKNTINETVIESMAKVLANSLVIEDIEELDFVDEMPMYVLGNKRKMYGASAIYNRRELLNFAQEHNTNKIVVIPSSIHEMLIIPYSEGMSIDDFSAMIKEVNETEVAEEERLSDRAYLMEL